MDKLIENVIRSIEESGWEATPNFIRIMFTCNMESYLERYTERPDLLSDEDLDKIYNEFNTKLAEMYDC